MRFRSKENTDAEVKALFEKARSMRLEQWMPDFERLFGNMTKWKGAGLRISNVVHTFLDFLREIRLILYKTSTALA
jgi:hypothetical protein